MEKKRNFGLDLVRAAAAILVICEHFFLNAHYYDIPLAGTTMAIGTWLRMLFMSCTPMFMMLSGYLCLKKKWNRGYLRGVISLLLIWVLSSVLCLAFRRFWMKETVTVSLAVKAILNFSAVPYGWYVEMYLGLFLLIPFLNAAWNATERTGRRNLVLSLAVLSLVPSVLNHFVVIVPDWWSSLYPIAYYFLGAWLKEYPLKIKSGWLLLGWAGFAGLTALMRWVELAGEAFTWTGYVDRTSIFVAAQSVCLFSFLSRFGGERCPERIRRLTGFIAKLSLPFYLASYISDNLLYPYFCELLPTLMLRILFLPVIVLAVAALSLVIAWAVNAVTLAIMNRIPKRTPAVSER